MYDFISLFGPYAARYFDIPFEIDFELLRCTHIFLRHNNCELYIRLRGQKRMSTRVRMA